MGLVLKPKHPTKCPILLRLLYTISAHFPQRKVTMMGFDVFRERTPQHIAPTVELSRRDELTSFKRFWVGFAMGMVAVSMILVTVSLIRH